MAASQCFHKKEGGNTMKYLYLDNKHNEFIVDDGTYEEVYALVQAGKLCVQDWRNPHPYTLENPCVAQKICLQHLLNMQPNLTLLDSPLTNKDGQHFYRFVDQQGYVYTSTEDVSTEASKNTSETLVYYGFTPPTKVQSRGKSVDFSSYYARLYGNLRNSVIVLSYDHYTDKVRGLYLLYKDGPCTELSRKSDLYRRADALVEATKDEQGNYHVNGYTHVSKYEADVFEVVSQLESALYDVTRKLQNNNEDRHVP
jgi:hypothetical protein